MQVCSQHIIVAAWRAQALRPGGVCQVQSIVLFLSSKVFSLRSFVAMLHGHGCAQGMWTGAPTPAAAKSTPWSRGWFQHPVLRRCCYHLSCDRAVAKRVKCLATRGQAGLIQGMGIAFALQTTCVVSSSFPFMVRGHQGTSEVMMM